MAIGLTKAGVKYNVPKINRDFRKGEAGELGGRDKSDTNGGSVFSPSNSVRSQALGRQDDNGKPALSEVGQEKRKVN